LGGVEDYHEIANRSDGLRAVLFPKGPPRKAFS
jgi:hypothetical protein